MKHELIKTDYHLLVVSDEEIKEDMWFYNPILNVISINSNADGCKKVIAHLPLKDLPVLEGVDLLPPLPQGKDANLSELHKAYADCTDCSIVDFTIGYNKAKEKYKYTERQLDEAIDWAITNGRKGDVTIMDIDNYIQSINQPKLPIAFETTCDCQECGANKTNLSLDMGCENKIATTINSQGQTEWVGNYIYN
jgi:hypothetical protein